MDNIECSFDQNKICSTLVADKNIGELAIQDNAITDIACNTQFLYTGDSHGHLYLTDLIKKTVEDIPICGKSITCIALSPDKTFVLVGCGILGGYLRKFSFLNKKIEIYGKIHESLIKAIVITPDSEFAFIYDTKGDMKKLSLQNKNILEEHSYHKSGNLLSIAYNDKYIFTSCDNSELQQFPYADDKYVQYDYDLKELLCGIKPDDENQSFYNSYSMQISPDKKAFYLGSGSGCLLFFDIKEEKLELVQKCVKIFTSEIKHIVTTSNNKS